MALTPRLDLRQAQTLVMTPQLQQAIKLLQMSNMELDTYVEQELERNPLLERDDRSDELDEPRQDERVDTSEKMLDTISGQDETPLDVDVDNSYADSYDDTTVSGPDLGEDMGSWKAGAGGSFEGEMSLENTLSGEVSLREHLLEQISMDLPDPADRVIGLHLMDRLDESGYVTEDLYEVAALLNCGEDKVEAVLSRMQAFDPPGIFARSLSECLKLQLIEKNRWDPAMEKLVENLDLLAKRDFPALIKVCGIDREDLAEMIDEIKALTPRPAGAFDHAEAQPVTPDVLMRPKPGGGWIVELNTDTLPRVLVNARYYTQVAGGARSKEEKTYISDCFQSANWLVKSLHQRATTILKVATELVRQQEAFFTHGVGHLKPLILRDIADAIDMHESTVSRVTSNKFIATPRGIYEMKYFFTQALGSSNGGDTHSAESVRHRIKALIDAEAPKKILSDDKIVAILKAEGIDIARRTVAKYREGLGIASSVQRRREKNLRL